MTAQHAHGAPPAGPVSLAETHALTRGITRLSIGVALILTAIKAAAWLASGSVAMLASLADSSLDVIASAATFAAVRYAAAPPDRAHRYGHGKAEAFASLLQAGLVFGSAALVAEEAIRHLIVPAPLQAEGWAMGVMAVSVVLTGALVAAQTQVLNQTRSVAVSGDRAHYAVDLASNLAAFAGIGLAAWLGSPRWDAAAGLVVAAWLVWGAVKVFRDSSDQLMDHELPNTARREIVKRMIQDPKVRGVHELRTRASGPYIHIQMHADLEPTLSLEEAHDVMVEAENRVLEAFPSADIIIHPDPQDRAEAHGGAFAETGHRRRKKKTG